MTGRVPVAVVVAVVVVLFICLLAGVRVMIMINVRACSARARAFCSRPSSPRWWVGIVPADAKRGRGRGIFKDTSLPLFSQAVEMRPAWAWES